MEQKETSPYSSARLTAWTTDTLADIWLTYDYFPPMKDPWILIQPYPNSCPLPTPTAYTCHLRVKKYGNWVTCTTQRKSSLSLVLLPLKFGKTQADETSVHPSLGQERLSGYAHAELARRASYNDLKFCRVVPAKAFEFCDLVYLFAFADISPSLIENRTGLLYLRAPSNQRASLCTNDSLAPAWELWPLLAFSKPKGKRYVAPITV